MNYDDKEIFSEEEVLTEADQKELQDIINEANKIGELYHDFAKKTYKRITQELQKNHPELDINPNFRVHGFFMLTCLGDLIRNYNKHMIEMINEFQEGDIMCSNLTKGLAKILDLEEEE